MKNCIKTGLSMPSGSRLKIHPTVSEYLKKASKAAKPALEALCEQCKSEGWTLSALVAKLDGAIEESKWRVCEKSGLRFRAKGRETTHPEIAWYSQHSDREYRYAALRVIERGKRDGWDSIEKFKAEIKVELNPDAPEEGDVVTPTLWVSHLCYDRSEDVRIRGYCAKILGPCDTYGYERQFLKPVAKQGKRTVGFLLTQDGVYDSKSYSRAGNCDHRWWKVVDAVATEITCEEAELIAGPPALTDAQKLAIANKHVIADRLARRATATEVIKGDFPHTTGTLFDRDGQTWIVVDTISERWWEDEDGVRGKGRYYGEGNMINCDVWERVETWIRPASAEEIAEHQTRVDRESQRKSHWQRLLQIYQMADCTETAIVPNERVPWPRGVQIEIPVSPGTNYLVATDTEVWAILYNGRDGDDWSLSNVGDGIGSYIANPDLAKESTDLIKTLAGSQYAATQ